MPPIFSHPRYAPPAQAADADLFAVAEMKERLRLAARAVGEGVARWPYSLGGRTLPGTGGALVAASGGPAGPRGGGDDGGDDSGAGRAGTAAQAHSQPPAQGQAQAQAQAQQPALLAEASRYVKAVSAVLRLGRSGAMTGEHPPPAARRPRDHPCPALSPPMPEALTH